MTQFRILETEELHLAYKNVFKEAFPPSELKPLMAIKKMIRKGVYDVMGLFEEGIPRGYVCLWRDEPETSPFILLDYLCVPKEERSRGIGTQVIREIRSHYPPNTVFIVESEAEGDESVSRRLDFYKRSGGYIASYDTGLFGVHYKTIVFSNDYVSDDEVMARHDGFYSRHMGGLIYKKYVQIPLKPDEKIHPYTEWREPRRKGE